MTGLNQTAMNRLGSGTLDPGLLLPAARRPRLSGPTASPCPYGDPGHGGNLAKAKQLVQQSGMAGTPVTVWSQGRTPRQQWMTYYTQFLNQIGFKATQKVIADATYFTTIGEPEAPSPDRLRRLEPGLPEPDRLLPAGQRQGDPADEQRELRPDQRPVHQRPDREARARCRRRSCSSVASQWQALDEYLAKKAYVAVFGYQTFPKFASDRIDYGASRSRTRSTAGTGRRSS